MTTVAADPGRVTGPSRHRLIRKITTVVAVVVSLTAFALWLARHVSAVREANHYKPLSISTGAAVFYGPDVDSPYHLAGEFDSLHIAGPAGTEQRFLVPLSVDGSHDVRIISIRGEDLVARVQWSKYVVRGGDYISGRKEPWTDFPETVKGHQTIRLGIILRKPAGCGSGLSRPWRAGLTVRWSALGRTHTAYLRAVDSYTLYGCG